MVLPAQRGPEGPDAVNVGAALTVTVVVCQSGQPAMVYDILAVPADTPVTIPPLTVATDVLLLLHEPVAEGTVRVAVLPVQRDMLPFRTSGVSWSEPLAPPV